MARQNRYVAKIGTVAAVCQNPAARPAGHGVASKNMLLPNTTSRSAAFLCESVPPVTRLKFVPSTSTSRPPDNRHRTASICNRNIGCATPYISVRHSHSTGP